MVNEMNIEQYGMYFLYTMLYVVLAVILKHVLNFRASSLYDADDEISSGNLAVGLRRAGAQLGLVIAVMGALSGADAQSLIVDLIDTATYGLLAVIFMVSSLVTTDKLVLPGINNLQSLKDNNTAVGIVEFGMLVGTGIIAYSSIVGEGGGVLSSVIYFIVGQASLVALVLFYEKVILRNFNIVKGVGEKNLSSGIYLCGKIIAYALILKSAIAGSGVDNTITQLITEYLFVAIGGMILLYIFEILIDRLIVTSTKVALILEEDKLVAAFQLSVAKVGMALLLSNAIL